MKIDFSTVLVDIEGEPYETAKKGAVQPRNEKGEPLPFRDEQMENLTLGLACKIALTAVRQDPQEPAQSFDDMMLAIKVAYAAEIEITETEAERIRSRAAKTFSTPEIPARVMQLLKGEKQTTAKAA